MFLFRNLVLLEARLGKNGLLCKGKARVPLYHNLTRLLSSDDKIIRSTMSLDVPNISFWELMEERLQKYGNRCALECGKTKQAITYEQLLHKAKMLSMGIPEIGVEKGHTVATFLFNSINIPVITLGLARAGAIMAPVNPNLTSGELCHLLNLSQATTVITETKVLPIVEEAMKKTPSVTNVVLTDGNKHMELNNIMSLGKTDPSIEINPKEDVVFRNCSSGTTGPPKIVEITHRNVVANILQTEKQHLHLRKVNTGMIVGLCEGLYRGDHVVTLPAFRSEPVIQAFKDYKFHSLGLVPPMIQFIVGCSDITKEDLDSVYWVWYGAAPTGKTTLTKLQQKTKEDIVMNERYGLTECILTHMSVNVLGYVGTIQPGAQAKVVDIETGNALGPNQEGEVCVRSPAVMKGYLNNPKATNEMIRDGWCYTGDIGWYDEQHHFFLTGRSKELIKVKGNQVAPAELENLLREHPAIADVAVVSVEDDKAGELPRAFIVLKKDATLSGNIYFRF